jgi:murein tripeptide amidase MpaA
MLNPDGVVNGNYRCNLTGTDINRNWVNPSKQYFQCIYRAKQSIKHFHLERQIKLILDFHSHSKK